MQNPSISINIRDGALGGGRVLETWIVAQHAEIIRIDSDLTSEITRHTLMNENIRFFMRGFRCDAHPMSMFISAVAALSAYYPEAREVTDPDVRRKQIVRLIAKAPTIAAFAHRHNNGLPYVYPDDTLSYSGNFLNMVFKKTDPNYRPDPILERALDIIFILLILFIPETGLSNARKA